MSIETVLLIVILTFGFGIMLDRWNMRLSCSRRRHAEWARHVAPNSPPSKAVVP